MAEKTTYVIELNDRLSPGLKKATAKALGLDNSMKGVSRSTKGASMSMGSLIGKLGLATVAFQGLRSAIQFTSESVRTAREFESLTNSINFASGGAEAGAENMDFLRNRAELLGADLMSSAEGFKLLSASMIGTNLEGQATRDIFDGISVASSTLQLTSEQTKGSILALSQMMGKGKVSAEELRQQLAERIPGAVNIAARAMNVTTGELDEMLQKGELMAEDFLPRFSNELKKTFGPGLKDAVDSGQANLNRFNNTLLDIKLAIGRNVLPLLTDLMQTFRDLARPIGRVVMPIIKDFFARVRQGFVFIKTNVETFKKTLQPLEMIFKRVRDVYVGFYERLRDGASVVDMVQGALNGLRIALEFLRPVFLKAVMTYKATFDAILKVKDAFNGFLDRFPVIGKAFTGFIYMLREGFMMILDTARKTLTGVGDLLAGIFSGDADQIGRGLKGILSSISVLRVGDQEGNRLGSAFKKGFNKSFGEDITVNLAGATGKKKERNFSEVLKDNALGKITGGAGGAGDKKGKKSSTSVDGVKSGRPTNVNISIGKLVETLNLTTTDISDLSNKTKDAISEILLSAVNNVNNIAR